MYAITKCASGYISLLLNKTAQPDSLHCTKLHNEVHNCCIIKSIEKLNCLSVLVLLIRPKIKFTASIEYSSY